MGERYSGYLEYKNSGVEWLNVVPNHWDVRKFGYVSSIVRGGSPRPAGDPTLFNGDYSPWVTVAEITKDNKAYLFETETFLTRKGSEQCRVFSSGTLLLSNSGATLGVPKILCIDANANDGVVGFEHLLLNKKFAYFYLSTLTEDLRERIKQGSGQPNLNTEIVKGLAVPVPSPQEQDTIVAFLDHETAKIDTLIEKQQRLIELLKEKRQAVISHAVTKGLNPDAPMKDSGVEWLGEVPEHWLASSLKRYSQIIDCKHLTADFIDDGFPLASIGEVKGWHVNLDNAKHTSRQYYEQLIEGGRKPTTGDIIYSRNATVGEAALVNKKHPAFAMGQDVCLIRSRYNLSSKYLLYVLKSGIIRQQLDLAMVGSTFKRINVDNIRNFFIAFPPLEEQHQIERYLSKTSLKYDAIMDIALRKIDLLQERRTALISAAVTGKIDVRGWEGPQ